MTSYIPGSLSAFFDGEEPPKPEVKKRKVKSYEGENVETPAKKVKQAKKVESKEVSPMPGMNDEVVHPEKLSRRTKREKSNKKVKRITDATNEMRRTVFVGNLPNSLTLKKIKRLFTEFGAIESLRQRSVVASNPKIPKKAAVITKQYSENMHGINVYIKFKEQDSADLALKLNGELVKKHHIRVDACWKNNLPDNKRTLFVGNLPYQTHEDKLWDIFSVCGDIESVRIVRDPETGLCKGIAFVCFKDSSGVELGLKMDANEFEGRNLRVNRAVSKEAVPGQKSQSNKIGKQIKLVGKLGESHTLKNKGALKFMDSGRRKNVKKMIDKKNNKIRNSHKSLMK